MERMLNKKCQVLELPLLNPVGGYAKNETHYHTKENSDQLVDLLRTVFQKSELIDDLTRARIAKNTEGS
jgi:hypothetical protein